MSAQELLTTLSKYDAPTAYRLRFEHILGCDDCRIAAEIAGETPQVSLSTVEGAIAFLGSIWEYASKALDHGSFAPELRPLLEQLESELAGMVKILEDRS